MIVWENSQESPSPWSRHSLRKIQLDSWTLDAEETSWKYEMRGKTLFTRIFLENLAVLIQHKAPHADGDEFERGRRAELITLVDIETFVSLSRWTISSKLNKHFVGDLWIADKSTPNDHETGVFCRRSKAGLLENGNPTWQTIESSKFINVA